jgi:nucleotide-binding universal stress UspA family protein
MDVILVPVDFSEATTEALRIAWNLASDCAAKVYLLHVEQLCAEDLKGARPQRFHREFLVRLAREDHRELRQLAQDLRLRGCDADALLVRGYTVDKILNEARRLKADLIVMGSHGHGRLYDALVGSICQGVLRKATVPVLVVPARAARGDGRLSARRVAEY